MHSRKPNHQISVYYDYKSSINVICSVPSLGIAIGADKDSVPISVLLDETHRAIERKLGLDD